MHSSFLLSHRIFLLCTLALTSGITCAPSNAQTSPTLTPLQNAALAAPSTPLLPENPLGAFVLTGRDSAKARVRIVPATHPEFSEAIRAETLESIAQPYQAQLSARNLSPISKGDVLFASFWARTIESPMGEAFVGFTFEQGAEPFKRSLGVESSTGSQWKQFTFPFKSAEDYAPGEAVMNLRLGYLPQTVEIGGIALRNYAANTSVESLPFTIPSYAGREANAPWRRAAQERIEKIRKADMRVVVQDKQGRPVPGAQVTIEQTRHAFGFGSAVNAKALLSTEPADQAYAAQVRSLFNKIVFENDLKWHRWDEDRTSPAQAIAWLREANIDARGHVLVWPSWRHSPPALEKLKADPAALQKLLTDHITDEVGALKGQLPEWDVLNEPFANHDVMDLLGPQVQTEWFKTARQADPNAKLYLNDYNILEVGGTNYEHQQHFENTIQYLLDHQAPLDGIGIQGHFGWNLTPPTKMLAILDRFAKFNKPIQITEFDVSINDEKLQADFTRDFLTAMFSHPSVNGVVMWGFWEGRHYSPIAALWRKDWTPKPNGQAWMDLVQKEWHTHLESATKANGTVATRGFLGDYQVTVAAQGQTVSKNFKLTASPDGEEIVVTLP